MVTLTFGPPTMNPLPFAQPACFPHRPSSPSALTHTGTCWGLGACEAGLHLEATRSAGPPSPTLTSLEDNSMHTHRMGFPCQKQPPAPCKAPSSTQGHLREPEACIAQEEAAGEGPAQWG